MSESQDSLEGPLQQLRKGLKCANCILAHTFDGAPAEVRSVQVRNCTGVAAGFFERQLDDLTERGIFIKHERDGAGLLYRTSYELVNGDESVLIEPELNPDCDAHPIEIRAGKQLGPAHKAIVACISCQFAKAQDGEPMCSPAYTRQCTGADAATVHNYFDLLANVGVLRVDTDEDVYTPTAETLENFLPPKLSEECGQKIEKRRRYKRLPFHKKPEGMVVTDNLMRRLLAPHPLKLREYLEKSVRTLLDAGVLELGNIYDDQDSAVAKRSARIAKLHDLVDPATDRYLRMNRVLLNNFSQQGIMAIAYHLRIHPLFYGPEVTAKHIKDALRLESPQAVDEYARTTLMPQLHSLMITRD